MSSPSSPVDINQGSGFSLLSPSTEAGYSSDDGDALRTPFEEQININNFPHFFGHDQGCLLPGGLVDVHNQELNSENAKGRLQYKPDPLHPLSPSDFTRSQTLSLSSYSPRLYIPDSNDPDPFEAAFARRNEELVTQAPRLVQTSFAEACRYNPKFPAGHVLNSLFMHTYELGEELGSGGYGFVMTALHRLEGHEVAVKFIIKDKISEHGWTEDEMLGKLPTEIVLLSLIEHDNIVKCLDLFEDPYYFYLVQELHGTPWKKAQYLLPSAPGVNVADPSVPRLSHSSSEGSVPETGPVTPSSTSSSVKIPQIIANSSTSVNGRIEGEAYTEKCIQKTPSPRYIPPPQFPRRPSYDLFECIEQTPNKRLSEDQACYIFAQVVEAVHYLDSQGITHRDIKDENLVIDKNLKVKLIDFGSAIIVDPAQPRPYYNLFFGTTAYAASEILRKQPYQAPPAEVWTLGILLSYLVTGMSPFPTEKDAIEGRIILSDVPGVTFSEPCLDLIRRCLDPNPEKRADIREVRDHKWLKRTIREMASSESV